MEGKKLYKSNTDKKIAGVCGGIAEYFQHRRHAGAPWLGGVQPAGRQRPAGLYHRGDHHARASLLKQSINKFKINISGGKHYV